MPQLCEVCRIGTSWSVKTVNDRPTRLCWDCEMDAKLGLPVGQTMRQLLARIHV